MKMFFFYVLAVHCFAVKASVNIYDIIPMDVVFLIDGSESTGEESFNQAKDFILEWTTKMTFDETATRMAIIQASSEGVNTELNFQQSVDRNAKWIKNTIKDIPLRGGKKNTLGGLEAVRNVFKEHPRPISVSDRAVRRMTYILTDGYENEPAPASAQEIDMLYLFDVTASMSSQIENVKSKAVNIVGDVKERFPLAKLRMGFVGYRDVDDSERYVIHEFTENLEEFVDWMKKRVTAAGGGDVPEDVPGGLGQALDRSWEAPLTRILIHIADAPGHGDFLTVGSAKREEAKYLLEQLKCTKHVYSYLFLKPENMVKATENMIQGFREVSAKDCGSMRDISPDLNKWFVSESISSSSIVDRIIEETKITIEKVSYRDIKDDLFTEDVDLIGLGISSRADRKKLEIITEPLYHSDSAPVGMVLVPAADETLKDQGEKLLKFVTGKTNMCEPNPCKNGGECTQTLETSAECNCKEGYLGNRCQHELSKICHEYASRCKLYGYVPPVCHYGGTSKILKNCQAKWKKCSAHGFGSWC